MIGASCGPTRAMIAIDPTKTAHIGIAALHGDVGHLPALTYLDTAPCLKEAGGLLGRTAIERFWPRLDAARATIPDSSPGVPTILDVVIENPPPTFRKDRGRSGSQAVIGFGLGVAAGYGGAWAASRGLDASLLPNGDWRAWVKHAPWGDTHKPPPSTSRRFKEGAAAPRPDWLDLPACTARAPTRVQDGTGSVWSQTYEGCAHTIILRSLRDVQQRPATCPSCDALASAARGVGRGAAPAPAAPSTLGRVTPRSDAAKPHPDEHKAPQIAVALAWWPDVVGPFIAGRSIGRYSGRPPHEVPGIADACEAALMGAYALQQARAGA